LRTNIKHTLAITLLVSASQTIAGPDGPVIHEDGWSLETNFAFTDPMSALINPNDGLIYFGRRAGDIYRSDTLGNTEVLLQTDDVAGLTYDPSTGAFFYSEDFPGRIYRFDVAMDGTVTNQLWINGFHSGDDDPVGITPVLDDYTGTLLNIGDMVSTDRGFNGPNEIWSWSPSVAQGEVLVRDDNATLVDSADIAVKGSVIAIADRSGGIKLMADDASISTMTTNGITFGDVQGVAFDTRSDDLLVIDADSDAAYRVKPNGDVSVMFSGLGIAVTNWGGINIDDDGTTQRIIISSVDNDRVYVFSITPPCSAADLAGPFAELNFFDVSAFLSLYSAQDPAVDYNNDGVFNFFDVSAFLSLYSAGCP
jgi:hypothetical protein